MRIQSKTRSKSQRLLLGQAMVEYILIVAAVVSAVVIFKDMALGPIMNQAEFQSSKAGAEAYKGGKQDIREYYQDAKSGKR